jgi:BlaI family transcriptional regulator, penicillinase repressor
MGDEVSISDAEQIVMEVVWKSGGGTASAIISELSSVTDWNHRTIRTMLGRLVEKGVLERVGPEYRPVVRRTEFVRREGRSFLKKVFGGDAASLLLHFAKEARLSPEKVRQLRAMLEKDAAKGVDA